MACFRCAACSAEEVRFNNRGMIDEPDVCANADCREKFTMRIVHNRCHFFDKQVVKMQARPTPSRPGLRAAGGARRRGGDARCFAGADAASRAFVLGWVLLQGGGGRAARRDGAWCRRAGR